MLRRVNSISLKEHSSPGELAFTLAFAAAVAVDNRRRPRRIASVGDAPHGGTAKHAVPCDRTRVAGQPERHMGF